jgi:serine/threonine protein kinase
MHPEYFSALEEMHVGSEQEQGAGLSGSSFITGYYQKFFIEVKKLGTGSFGSVFLCKHVLNNIDLGTYAIKKIVLSDNMDWQKRVFREVRLLERVHHPNIIAYRHTWLENAKIADFGPTCPCLFLLMEYANAGNLDDYVELAEKQPLNEDDIWQIFIELLSGLRHLHHAGIIHRDMKVRNFL